MIYLFPSNSWTFKEKHFISDDTISIKDGTFMWDSEVGECLKK